MKTFFKIGFQENSKFIYFILLLSPREPDPYMLFWLKNRITGYIVVGTWYLTASTHWWSVFVKKMLFIFKAMAACWPGFASVSKFNSKFSGTNGKRSSYLTLIRFFSSSYIYKLAIPGSKSLENVAVALWK